MHLRLIAGAIVAVMAAGPAMAQDVKLSPKQAEQLACISNWLVKDKKDVMIADVYARGDRAGKDFETVSGAMDTAMVTCQQQHKWTDDQTNLAAQVGMFQLIYDANYIRLTKSPGVTDKSFEQIGAVLSAMPREDQDLLNTGAWRDDKAFLKRASDRLIAAGLPENSTTLAFAMLMMEAKLVVTFGQMDWVKLTP